MDRVIKIRRGLDIRLKGTAERVKANVGLSQEVGLRPGGFAGLKARPVVAVGDRVRVGDALFADKAEPSVVFASPASGVVTAVERGERRRLECVTVKTDAQQEYVNFGTKDVAALSGDDVVDALLAAGLFGYIDQLPFAVTASPASRPKAVFVSALRDKPLASDFEYELEGNERDFQTGLTALSRIAPTHLGIGRGQGAKALRGAKDVSVWVMDGPCPAGNVGVQVNHIDPVNKGEVVWTVDPSAVIFFGRLFSTGRVDLRRTVAVAGSEVAHPHYADVTVGQQISTLLDGETVAASEAGEARIVNGNVLTGVKCDADDFLGAHSSEVTVIPEGAHTDEFLGWIRPRLRQFSVSRSYFSWLHRSKEYALDARVKGGERHMIMSGEYDRVMPMDIYPEYLIKAIIAGDIDRMEALGIYEVSPEDFALAEFVDSSKLELQSIVRQGLDMMRKEM